MISFHGLTNFYHVGMFVEFWQKWIQNTYLNIVSSILDGYKSWHVTQ